MDVDKTLLAVGIVKRVELPNYSSVSTLLAASEIGNKGQVGALATKNIFGISPGGGPNVNTTHFAAG